MQVKTRGSFNKVLVMSWQEKVSTQACVNVLRFVTTTHL